MKVLYLEWNSFCNEDMFSTFAEKGDEIIRVPFSKGADYNESKGLLESLLAKSTCDFVFSFNYFPNVSICCEELGLKYVSWVYDSPHIQAYSYTVLNSCNYVFLFDYQMYEEFRQSGINTVYYLPLAVNEKRLSDIANGTEQRKRYMCDVSFVGSLYSEKKHRLYDKFQSINQYAKGYLDAIIQAQKKVYGYNFLQELLVADIVEEMQKAYPTDPNATTVLTPEAIYADYVLCRQVTALERQEILGKLGKKYRVNLFTNDAEIKIPGVCNKGKIDYYDQMPYVFMNSKINLNITLRSIKSGIPLRALDIMGSGGFLLSNYQQELFEYFEEGKDFVAYTDYNDLLAKVEYYLDHDSEREEIAKSGCVKVRKEHTFSRRIDVMKEVVLGGGEISNGYA